MSLPLARSLARSALTLSALALTLGLSPLAARPAVAETVITRGISSSPGSIDQIKAELVQDAMIQYDLFEGLFTLDDRGRPRPAMAASYDVTPDGLVWTFKLREAKWSDGTPVTAHDFVFSWRRMVDPASASPYGYMMWPILNAEAISKGQMPIDTMGVEAVDDRTLKVTLAQPTGYFLPQLAHSSMTVMQKANVEKFGPSVTQPGNLVSNGAFILAEAVPQSHYTLVKNPHYYDADQVAIDKVVMKVTENADTEFKEFRAGGLDATFTLPVTQIEFARTTMPDAFRPSDLFATFYLSFNLGNEPWKSNPKLREAMSLAIDRKVIAEKVLGHGIRPAFHFVPQGAVEGYTSPSPDWIAMTQEQRNARAKALLAEAGYGPGGQPLPKPELLFSTNENNRRLTVALAAMWKQVLGIEVVLNNQEGRVVASMGAQKSYKDLHLFGWVGDYLDPYTFLKLLRSDVGQQNYSGYSNAAYDALLDEANRQLDPEKRMTMLSEAEAMMLADNPVITINYTTRRRVVNPKISGWVPNARDQYPSRYLKVAQ